MSDLVERLRLGFARGEISVWKILPEAADEIERLRNQLGKARDFANWVDSWVSQPAGSYSVYALDGLFGMTRDKIAALSDDRRPAVRTSFVLDGSCPTCAALARGELCPPHDASPRCESGRRNHCSCDICF